MKTYEIKIILIAPILALFLELQVFENEYEKIKQKKESRK
jgi:hypothetical protein